MNEEYYFINQDNEKSSSFCIFFEKYPEITHGQKEYERQYVAGKGYIYTSSGAYEDTKIGMLLDVNIYGTNEKREEACIKAREFIRKTKEITFCDRADYFYKIKKIEIGEIKQYSEEAGDFQANLLCEAGQYLHSGKIEYAFDDKALLYNPYDESRPVYKITGEGACNLVVNGKTMKANVSGNLTIDTERMISYREDGKLQNTSVTGDYEELYLLSGDNTIEITNGFYLSVVPNWRCF